MCACGSVIVLIRITMQELQRQPWWATLMMSMEKVMNLAWHSGDARLHERGHGCP